MNIQILESGVSRSHKNFINTDTFYCTERKQWLPVSGLYNSNYKDRHYYDIIRCLEGTGTVKHLTELYDQNGHSIIEFKFNYENESRTVITRGTWGKGFTKSETLVAIDKDGEIVKPNYTTFDFINTNGAFNKLSVGLHSTEAREYLKKICRIDHVGKISHHGKKYDAFMIHCSVLEANGASFFALGHLNNSVFSTNFFDSI
ncbi:MAG: hypothetical protein RL621_64 [Bacteroidota bacterium]|jgi:hypothetical protein